MVVLDLSAPLGLRGGETSDKVPDRLTPQGRARAQVECEGGRGKEEEAADIAQN